jgi:hypothetical protein
MIDKKIIEWLLEGDVSIQYQVYRDLLDNGNKRLQERIAKEGWGERFISQRKNTCHWGRGFYQPKWISTHYTLLDLKNLCISPVNKEISETLSLIMKTHIAADGGISPSGTIKIGEVCVSGMFLNYASYFKINADDLTSIIDFLVSQQMNDGGFNCHSNRQGAAHSSLHTTISVLEGFLEYRVNGYTYRIQELKRIEKEALEFILQHRLFKSHRTGQIIDKKMMMLSFPCRWRYDILRALDYFQSAGVKYDLRMQDAIDVLMKKKRADGKWPLQCRHPGQTHFEMEVAGEPCRWNTLRALRVLKNFNIPV